jgi:transcriptional regulator with XRE-family HTH domain
MAGETRPVWAVRLQYEREARGWDTPEMARQLRAAITDPQCPSFDTVLSYVKRWEAGRKVRQISTRYRLAYAKVLDLHPSELFGTGEMPCAVPASPAVLMGSVKEKQSIGWDDEMERRRLLQLLATGAGMSALGLSEEAVRQLLDHSLSSEPRSIDDWELATADHLHALRTRPPAQAREDLVVDLLAIQRQLKSAGPADTIELQRVVAALSTLHANLLTRIGDHGSAIRWWRTAKGAADVTGDLELRLRVRATEAGHGLYGQRDAGTVLRLTQDAQQLAGNAPSLGLALNVSTQAKALTLLGRRDEARQTLNTYRDLAVAEPPSAGIMSGYWNGGQLHFAGSLVLSGIGDETGAAQAKVDVLASARALGNDDYQFQGQLKLHDALCTVVNGGISEGAQLAVEAFDSVPSSFRSNMITETGRFVLRAIPFDQHQGTAASDLRHVLTA